MSIDENILFISDLIKSENKTLHQIGHSFKRVFCAGDNSTSVELLRRCTSIEQEVKDYFPYGFAERFQSLQKRKEYFHKVMEGKEFGNPAEEFEKLFSELRATWMMLLELLPFLFMLSVNRMGKKLIFDFGKREFEKAFSLYKIIYHKNQLRDIEENKGKLTTFLIQLFRRLYSKHKVSSEFMLHLITESKNGFNELFPVRFNSIILLFSKFNENKVEELKNSCDHRVLQRIIFLVNWALLDMIDTIKPIFMNFYLVYISEILVGEEPYQATGLSITGTGELEEVGFYLQATPQSDSNRLQTENLYLINRKKEIGFTGLPKQEKKFLTPEDYMNLTPLMLYTRFMDSSVNIVRRLKTNKFSNKKGLFVFHGYDSSASEKFLKFLEYSGARVARIIKSKKSRYYKLFEEYESFSKNLNGYYIDIEKLIKKVELEQDSNKKENFKFVFYKTWDLSLGHISSLLRIDEYDSEAALIETMERRNEKMKFIERLFVSPKEEKILEEFINSDKRGFILIGKSGMGKSNLLCAGFLKQRRKYHLNIFIDARRLKSIDIKNSLTESITARINDDWGLKEFDDFLERNKTKITIFIDAVNEYNNVGSALGLLETICDFVEDANIFKNVKIIASCRNETWDQYKKKIGHPTNILNDKYFYTQAGDAVSLSGFEEGKEREKLYASYQFYYMLKPESYYSLSQAVKELIKQPFMMGFIAEIYSYRYEEKPDSSKMPKPGKIPKALDYFKLFDFLTDRKKEDAKRLLAKVEHRDEENFDMGFKDCLYWFARILYDKIIEPANTDALPGASKDKSDSLKIDQLNKNKNFNKFFNSINPYDDTSIFTAIIQVGLIERIYVDEEDYWGNKKSGRAYKFFHDQFTQFWLSAVFNKVVLGRINNSAFQSDKKMLDTTVDKIEYILEVSQNAAVLSGALYHWLYNNVFDKKKNPNPCFSILFNRLVQKNLNHVNYFVGSFLHWLIEANIITAQLLHKELVQNGDISLRKCFYQHIPQVWPEIEANTLQTILAAEKKEELITSLSDIFVNIFTLESAREVIDFIDRALLSYESLKDITGKVFKISSLRGDALFMLTFIIQSFLCNFTKPEKLAIIREFLKKKYKWVFNVLINKEAWGLNKTIRDFMYRAIETSGIHQWKQAVTSQARNRLFFEDDGGVVQRDVLRKFYKYPAAFHNDKLDVFSWDIESEYMDMTFKMIEYSNRGLIGYVATIILVGRLKDHVDRLDEIIDEIIKRKSIAGLAYSISIIHMLAKLEPGTVDHIMDIIHEKLLPEMIDNLGMEVEDKFNISSYFVIAAEDLDRHWKKCEAILNDIIDHLTKKGDKKKVDDFGAMMVEVIFPPDVRIGINLCDFLLKKKLHLEPLWHDFTFTLLAGMLTRSHKTLVRILDANLIQDTIINDIRPFLTEDIINFGSKVSYQHAWNNLLVLGFINNKEISYLFIKYVLADLVKAQNLEDAAELAPKLVVESIRRFIMEDNKDKTSIEDLKVDEMI